MIRLTTLRHPACSVGRPIGLLLMLLLAGCGGEGYLSHLVHGPDRVPAAFTLDQRPTLILVDDPGDRLADPNLALTIAQNVAFDLARNNVLQDRIIPAEKLAALQAAQGQAFARMPVDAVGRAVGAEQVVHILIEEVTLEYAPTVYRPRAAAQVKVIDAATGLRLFPDPPAPNQPPSDAPVRGHPVVTQMQKVNADHGSVGTQATLRRQLAQVIGRDVARQFYRWKPAEIGRRFEEP